MFPAFFSKISFSRTHFCDVAANASDSKKKKKIAVHLFFLYELTHAQHGRSVLSVLTYLLFIPDAMQVPFFLLGGEIQ